MSFEMRREHLNYALLNSQEGDTETEAFFAKLSSQGADDVVEKVRGIRDSFFENHAWQDLPPEHVQLLEWAMLRILAFTCAGPYAANDERVPEGLLEVFEEVYRDCENPKSTHVLYEHLADLGDVYDIWMGRFSSDLHYYGFHSLRAHGPVFALAYAWVIACEEDQQRAAHRLAAEEWAARDISPSVTKALGEALGGETLGNDEETRQQEP